MKPYQLVLRSLPVKRFRNYGTRWELENPQINEVYVLVQQALRLGWLKRGPCEVCGARGESHHDDYDKPLAVRWLRRMHHRQLHARIATPEEKAS